MAIKLIGTFIEITLKNNFGEFDVQNNKMVPSKLVITDLINIIAQVYYFNYSLFYKVLVEL